MEVINFGRLTSRVGCCVGKDVGLPRYLGWEDDRLGIIGRILGSISGWLRILVVVGARRAPEILVYENGHG